MKNKEKKDIKNTKIKLMKLCKKYFSNNILNSKTELLKKNSVLLLPLRIIWTEPNPMDNKSLRINSSIFIKCFKLEPPYMDYTYLDMILAMVLNIYIIFIYKKYIIYDIILYYFYRLLAGIKSAMKMGSITALRASNYFWIKTNYKMKKKNIFKIYILEKTKKI